MNRQGEIAKGPRISCRIIVPDDEAALVALLCEGFAERPAAYWSAAVSGLRRRRTPESFPRYGYCLTADDRMVGAVLLIHSAPLRGGGPIRCCVSSWFVEPQYRIYATALVRVALRRQDCIFVNISAAPHTRPGLSAQGYSCYARGQFLALPALGQHRSGIAVNPVRLGQEGLDEATAGLLLDHAEAGCIALTCNSDAFVSPFVFRKRCIRRFPLPCAQLIYCESVESFVGMQGPLGRYLARQGLFWVMLDANGPVNGLRGLFLDRRMPKYYKGSARPQLGDLSYTEIALFGA